jgi:hypothetical protein
MDFSRLQKLAGLDSKKAKTLNENQDNIAECGEMDDVALEMHVDPIADIVDVPEAVSESQTPEGELIVEMEMASRNLELVVESISAAASLCPSCTQEVASVGPLVEAMVAQAQALQETLDAAGIVVSEHVELDFTGDVAELPGDEAFAIGLEAGRQGLA